MSWPGGFLPYGWTAAVGSSGIGSAPTVAVATDRFYPVPSDTISDSLKVTVPPHPSEPESFMDGGTLSVDPVIYPAGSVIRIRVQADQPRSFSISIGVGELITDIESVTLVPNQWAQVSIVTPPSTEEYRVRFWFERAANYWLDDPQGLVQPIMPPQYATLSAQAKATSAMTATRVFMTLMSAQARARAEMSASVRHIARIAAQSRARAAMAATQTLFAVKLLAASRAKASLRAFGNEREVWATNLDNNGATRYSRYDYNSFATTQHRSYGCRPEGIYALEGEDDAGELIEPWVDLGLHDFGTTLRKRIPNVYLGATSGARLKLQVQAGGAQYEYRARSYGEDLGLHRFDIGKGLFANNYGFVIRGDGAGMNLLSVEFVIAPSERRRT